MGCTFMCQPAGRAPREPGGGFNGSAAAAAALAPSSEAVSAPATWETLLAAAVTGVVDAGIVAIGAPAGSVSTPPPAVGAAVAHGMATVIVAGIPTAFGRLGGMVEAGRTTGLGAAGLVQCDVLVFVSNQYGRPVLGSLQACHPGGRSATLAAPTGIAPPAAPPLAPVPCAAAEAQCWAA